MFQLIIQWAIPITLVVIGLLYLISIPIHRIEKEPRKGKRIGKLMEGNSIIPILNIIAIIVLLSLIYYIFLKK